MRHPRLLAIKNGLPKELEYASCGNAFSYEKYKKLKMKKEDSSTYKRLKREGLNELDIYKKSFACKYSKKKGLTKLDCYCEKKIFDKLDGIYLLAKNMKDDKKGFKKKICKRYGLPFVLSLIFVLTVATIDVLDGSGVKCFYSKTSTLETLSQVGYSILLDILPIIIFLVLAYITIKIKKYDRLVEGKGEGKMIAKYISCYYDDTFNSKG
ncbi:hypothetical protein PVNG_06331 [Plasmodium vivax North Korean]|uniref:Variable surface protein Vir35 n=1 Tax=Plasmodium vivax North Korean TaxID=1035514 RepID=A0A0J9WF40_PLAVI|nr:hypothetical protein PVNG_06331 [Plasmodium vivax North Korean]